MKKYILASVLLATTSAHAALKVSPMMLSFKDKPTAEIVVENTSPAGTSPLNISIGATNDDDKRIHGYIVYPPIIRNIKGGEKRTIRVMKKTPVVADHSYIDVSSLNDNYKVKYKLLIINKNEKF